MRARGFRTLLRLAPFAVLAAENLAIFFRHYFAGYGFPWDFVGTYYAAAAYWTEALSRGALPMWMPFQSMGHPFLLNLQTGLWYPPMWVFPLLHIPYTLSAAVVLQCLHVLAGALGMYVLLRAVTRSRREALLGAFCFQLFGGFYSNAEHVDIVRAFALTPWLLWCLVPSRGREGRFPGRLAALPFAVFAMSTGGYPGNLIAALLLVGVLVALRLLEGGARRRLLWAAACAGGTLLGLAMAAVHLGPAWLHRAELTRFHAPASVYRASLGTAHLPGLLLANRGMPGDISMSSTFVGLLVLAGLCLLTRRALRENWPYLVVLALAAAMAAGNNLPLHPALRGWIAPLGFSRFPSSDYRGFAAVLLIVLAAAGWTRWRRDPGSPWSLALRAIPLVLFAAWSLARTGASRTGWGAPAQVAGCLVLVLIALRWQARARVWLHPILLLLLAASLDASRVLPRMDSWSVPNLIETCRLYAPTLARLHDAGRVAEPAVFSERAGPRPARIDGDLGYYANGYLTGTYNVRDFGGTALSARARVFDVPSGLQFMCREWLGVLVELPANPSAENVSAPGVRASLLGAQADSRVAQTIYGSDRIVYRVALDEPRLLIENEIYFPGWSARLSGGPGGNSRIDAHRVNDVWRGWILPAGTYTMEARFRLPGLRRFAALSAAAWLTWVLLCAALFRRSLYAARFRRTLLAAFPPARV